MYDLYSWLSLALSISCFSVAIALTKMKSHHLVDQSFTVREWMFGTIFLMTFIVTRGEPDATFDVFHGQAALLRSLFMFIVALASLVSAGTLLYTFYDQSDKS